jgi:putative component of membrane protein insertase Oxa1/YidC/SpoIIIJ protein YidD
MTSRFWEQGIKGQGPIDLVLYHIVLEMTMVVRIVNCPPWHNEGANFLEPLSRDVVNTFLSN